MANGLPAFEIPQPVLGQSAVPLGRLDEFEVPAEEELPVIAMPDDIATIGAPPVDVEVPAPAAQPSGVVDDFEVGPVADPAEIAFEAQPASPRAELAAGVSPEFVEQQFTVQTLSDQQDQLWKRSQELAFSLGSEKDPAKRAEREKQAQDNIAATQANQQQLRLARGMAQRTQAVETARLGDAMAAQQRRLAIDVEESALASEREQQIDDADRLRNQQAAQADVSAARERRAQIIERGPSKPAFARTAMAMITEALKPIARPDGTADYGAVVDRLMRETKEQHAREDAAAQLRVQIAGDEVGNIGRARKEEALQSAIVRELTARSLRIEVETAAANTKDEFAQARALTIGDDLKRHEAAAQATQRALAEDKAHKLAMDDAKRRKVEAEIALTGAKVGTEGQRALKLSAEAAKAARRGTGSEKRGKVATSSLFGAQIGKAVDAGQLDEKGAKLVFEQGVIDPVTGKLTTRANGSFVLAGDQKTAKELNEAGAMVARVNGLVNEALAMRGAQGWEPTDKFFASDAGKRMEAISTELLFINKDIFDLGVLSGDDVALLKAVQGGDLTGMKDPRPAMEDMRRRMIAAFNQKRKSLALGSQALTFTKVQAAPARSLRDVDTLLNQAPNLKTGDVPSVEARGAAADEKFELLVQKHNGNIRKASEEFTADTEVTLKRARAHRSGLNDEFNKELPANWKTLTTAAAKAALARQNLEVSGDATGEEINAAELAESTALRAAENALSPKAKKLRAGMREQATFIDDLTDKAGGELERQAESRKLDEERKVAEARELRMSRQFPTTSKF